ncbi:YfbM family protein [Flavobacterium sp. MC2016-06]|uniref:YfbM family protein n=1 Tax=Flavobacterium sp. MC2016-06 TaxID=2676308 RepID=UPI0012BAE0EE|nr:YfbM family protein [Flavobacterium sp. MC2016-06]
MTGNLLRVKETQLEAYLQDSSILEQNLSSEETPKEIEWLYIDKAWDGIIFLLTGKNMPDAYDYDLAQVLFSDQIVDTDQDLGYGPAYYLRPEQVVDINNQISEISIEDLKEKYDPKKMAEIEVYPAIWSDETESFEYLSHYFIKIQKIYSDAVKNGEAIVTFLS